MRNHFKRKHERNEHLGGAGKMVDVVRLPADQTHGVVEHEHKQRHAHGGVEVGCRSVKAGHKTHEVHAEDVDEHASQEANELASMLTHGGKDEVLDGIHQGFKKVLQTSGNHGQPTAHDQRYGEQNGHTDPGVEHMFEFHHRSTDGDLVHAHKCGEQYRMRQTTCHEPCLLVSTRQSAALMLDPCGPFPKICGLGHLPCRAAAVVPRFSLPGVAVHALPGHNLPERKLRLRPCRLLWRKQVPDTQSAKHKEARRL